MLAILPFRLAQWCIASLMRCSNTQGHMYHVYSNYTEALLSPALPRCYNADCFQELFSKGYRKAKNVSHVRVRRGRNKDGLSTLQEQFLKLKEELTFLLSACAPCKIIDCILYSSAALKIHVLCFLQLWNANWSFSSIIHCGLLSSWVSSEAQTLLHAAASESSSKEFPGQLRDIINSKCPSSAPPGWTHQRSVSREVSKRHPTSYCFNRLLSIQSVWGLTRSLRLNPTTIRRRIIWPAKRVTSWLGWSA